MSVTRPGLAAFNTADEQQVREQVRTWIDAPGWADRVLAGRPYADLGELAAAMGAAAATLDDEDLAQALARHPRIGERADAARHDAAHSTREQAGVDADDADLARRLEEGNRAYEERFGRVFIVRAAGRSGPEILEHLHARLDHTDEVERAVTVDELTQIAVLRMREALS